MESDSRFTVGSWRMRLFEQEPTIEAAQAGELAGGGARLDAVLAKMLEKSGDVILCGGGEGDVFRFDIFGELGEVSFVGLAGERPQTFFDAKIEKIFTEESGVAEHGLIIRHGIRAEAREARRNRVGHGLGTSE